MGKGRGGGGGGELERGGGDFSGRHAEQGQKFRTIVDHCSTQFLTTWATLPSSTSCLHFPIIFRPQSEAHSEARILCRSPSQVSGRNWFLQCYSPLGSRGCLGSLGVQLMPRRITALILPVFITMVIELYLAHRVKSCMRIAPGLWLLLV